MPCFGSFMFCYLFVLFLMAQLKQKKQKLTQVILTKSDIIMFVSLPCNLNTAVFHFDEILQPFHFQLDA